MRQRLLKQLQSVTLSPDEAWGLLDRVKSRTSSADDREHLAQLIRVTTAVTGQLRAPSEMPTRAVSGRSSPKPSAKRKRHLAKAARRRRRLSR
jgi:hypothetical protein